MRPALEDHSPDANTPTPFGRRVLPVVAVQLTTLVALYFFGRYFS